MANKAAQEGDTASRFLASAPLAPNSKLGKYEIRSQIGEGGCGVVYKGHDPFVDREVAVKVFHPIADGGTGTVTRVSLQDAFFAEARAAGKLHHPYVVTLFDAGHDDGRNYLVMEYVDGETLKKYCDSGAPMALERMAKIMLKCCLALDYTHGRGVLHRDIKPGNIMVKRDGTPKIMDFSIAALQAGAGTSGTTIVGSPMYMSPEQASGKELGPASDLYSLGVVMYHVLTGEPPFAGKTARDIMMHVKRTPVPDVRAKRPDLPEELTKVFEKLLAKDPAARHPSGKELAQDLGPFSEPRAAAKARRKSLEISNESLKQLKFFQAFKSKELAELMAASSTVTFQPGENIITEGETDNSLYILTMGVAEVHKNNRLIAVLEKGDCFGEIGFLYAVKRTASVVARTPVLLLKVNAALLDQMSEQCQLHYYKVFTENLIVRLSLTTERAAQLLEKSDAALDFVLA